jgi:hypothetical protein
MPSLILQIVGATDALLSALLVAAAVAGIALSIRIRRRRRLARAYAWTEPLDLQTLQSRMRIVEQEPATHLPQTRGLLDELHRRKSGDGASARVSGVAGASRRR